MTVMIAARWQLTFAVRDMTHAVQRREPIARRGWFAPPNVEKVAARQAMDVTLAQERQGWACDFVLLSGGVMQ